MALQSRSFSVDRETGESIGSSVSVLEEHPQDKPSTSAPSHFHRENNPTMIHQYTIGRPAVSCTSDNKNSEQTFTTTGTQLKRRHSSDIATGGSAAIQSSHSCTRSPSVNSLSDCQKETAGIRVITLTKRTATSLAISANRRRLLKSSISSQDTEECPNKPAPAKVVKLTLSSNSQKKDREAWAKLQKDILLLQKQRSAEHSGKNSHVTLTKPRKYPPPLVFIGESRKQLKSLAIKGDWGQAVDLVEGRFLTNDTYDPMLDEILLEAISQERWQAVEQLVGLKVGRRLLHKVVSAALEKNQWSWVRQMMQRNSQDVQFNTTALQEAVKIAQEEQQVLELFQDLNMECRTDNSFFDAVGKWFWRTASLMVRRNYVTHDQCREACGMALLQAFTHYRSIPKSGQPARNGDNDFGESGRLHSEKRRCTDMWSFLYLLAQLRVTRDTIQSCIEATLASNDWTFAKKLACLLPVGSEGDQLHLLITEAIKRDDWPFILSRLHPNSEYADNILQMAVARGMWKYAVQIVSKTRKEVPESCPGSEGTKLEALLSLQQRCSDQVMSSAFKMSVRRGDWAYVALLAHPSMKDKYRWVVLDEVILQWAHVFFKLLMQGNSDPPREDGSEGMFTPTPIPQSGSFTSRTSSGFFCWSPLSMSESLSDIESPLSPLGSLSESPFPDSASTLHLGQQTPPEQTSTSLIPLIQADSAHNDSAFFNCKPVNIPSLCTGRSVSSEKERSESITSQDDVFLPEEVDSSRCPFEWRDIRQNGQYLYTLVQITQCLSKEHGLIHTGSLPRSTTHVRNGSTEETSVEISDDQHWELMKDVLTRWAQAVKDLLLNARFANRFVVDEICCTMLYAVERNIEMISHSTDATSEMAWACVPVLVTQTINEGLAQFALEHTLNHRRWDTIKDILLFGLECFTENGRRLIFRRALVEGQWDVVQSLAESDLYQDQVKDAISVVMDNQQTDLVLILLDRQQSSQDDIQAVFTQAVQNCQWDLVLPLLERGATVSSLQQDSISQTSDDPDVTRFEEELISSIPTRQVQTKTAGGDLQQNQSYCQTMVNQLRSADVMSNAKQWELLQEAVSQHKWHMVAQVVSNCRIGHHVAVHSKLYPEALLQGQWGVIRSLIKRGVQDFPLCYQACCTDLIQRGKWSIVGDVFQNCVTKDEQMFSAILNLAVKKAEWSVVLQLVQTGVTKEQRMSLFHAAVANCNWQLMERLINPLAHEANGTVNSTTGSMHKGVNAEDSLGRSLAEFTFDHAVSKCNWEVVCLCVLHGVDINRQDKAGNTALHLAMMKKDKVNVHKLMQFGPDVNMRNVDQQTPLNLAARICAWDLVKLMMESGGDINIPDRKNNTALKFLLESAQASLLHMAVEKGCDITRTVVKDRTAYHVLLAAGFYQTVMKMVEHGADPSIVTDGKTLLYFSVNRTTLSSMESCVSLCIDLGLSTHQPLVTDTQMAKSSGLTPLCTVSLPVVASTRGLSESKPVDQLRNSPTCMALRNKAVPFKILWMLLESGASSNAELHLLRSSKQLQECAGTGENGRQKVLYLKITASNPHSLKHLCRLAISHQMGCKGDRPKRIAALPLPRRLKDYVSFSDILSVVKYQGKRML